MKNTVEECSAELIRCFARGGKLLVCGNGGSAADSAHIVGELVKGFMKKRPVDADVSRAAEGAPLQMGLPAIDLTAQGAVIAYPDLVILDFFASGDDFQVSEEEINIGISVQKGNTALVEAINGYLKDKTADDFNALMQEAIKVQPLGE